jgi:hypothetical protein
MFAIVVNQRVCHQRLEEAWAVDRIETEMRQDRQVTPLTAWLVECGHLP